jgi:hypothetical protein
LTLPETNRLPVTLLRRVLPWLVAGGILAFLFRRTGGAAVRTADVWLLLGATVACTLAMYVLDVVALSRVVSWFNAVVPMREIAPVKVAAYLINALNYNAGSGAIALWLKRRKGVPFLEGASSLLFMNVVDAVVLVAFIVAMLPALDGRIRNAVTPIVLLSRVALASNLFYWPRRIDFLVLGRLRTWSIFKSFREARAVHYAKLAAIRAPFDFFFVLNHWYGLRAFDTDARFLKVLAYVPTLSFIGVVPVSVGGLGTVQDASILLCQPYASEARILAFSLVMILALNGGRTVLGLPFFHSVSAQVLGAAANEA